MFLAVTELLGNAIKGLVLIRLVKFILFLAKNVQATGDFVQYFFADEVSLLWRLNVCFDARFQKCVQEHLLLSELVEVPASLFIPNTPKNKKCKRYIQKQ